MDRAPNQDDTYYPYSSDLQTLLDAGIQARMHPVYAFGLTREQLHEVRNAYVNPDAGFRVGIYGIYDTSILLSRVGIAPSVVIVNQNTEITGDIASFIKRSRIPVLRILDRWVPLTRLPRTDYYGGVYEVLESGKIACPREVTFMLNLGILIYLRNRGKWNKRGSIDLNSSDDSCFDVESSFDDQQPERKTRAVKRTPQMPAPEPSFDSFFRKQINAHEDIDTARIAESSRTFADASASGAFRVLTPEDIEAMRTTQQ